MTVAACYFSSEGVVLGADSTSTVFVTGPGGQPGLQQHYNFAQKVFEFGDPGATAGVAIWGVGSLGDVSYRTLVAEIADEARRQSAGSLQDVAALAARMHWDQYTRAFGSFLARAGELHAKGKALTQDEAGELAYWEQGLSGGLCLGGRWGDSRRPGAFEVLFGPLQGGPAAAQPLTLGVPKFWGCPNLIDRLIFAMDGSLFQRVLSSGKWTGTPDELFALVQQGALGHPRDLPLREAIDWIHASIYTTIKGMKFSHLAPACGGPIEVAVITSDRPFRWVRHKHLGEAIAAYQTKEDRP